MVSKIGIDIDGVLRNFMDRTVKVVKNHYPNEEVVDNTQYDLINWFPFFGESKNVYDFVFNKHANEIYLPAKQYPKAKEFMDILKEKGYQRIIVTSQPNDKTKELTLKWLELNEIDFDDLKFSSKKGEVEEIDLLLDDSTKNLQEFKDSGRIAVCMDRTWNQDWEGLRIKNYKEFLKLIEELNGSRKNHN